MRNLTNNEIFAVGGATAEAASTEGYAVNWWRAGFDVAAGGLGVATLGAVGAGLYSLAQAGHPVLKMFGAACGFAYGGAVGAVAGVVGGAAVAGAREAWNYYHQ